MLLLPHLKIEAVLLISSTKYRFVNLHFVYWLFDYSLDDLTLVPSDKSVTSVKFDSLVDQCHSVEKINCKISYALY